MNTITPHVAADDLSPFRFWRGYKRYYLTLSGQFFAANDRKVVIPFFILFLFIYLASLMM